MIHKEIVEKYAKDANIDTISNCITEARNKNRKSWKQLRLYYDSAQDKRETFLHQLISEKEDQDKHSRKKSIITLLKRQKTATRFRKKRGALNRLRGSGLNVLDTHQRRPIKDHSMENNYRKRLDT